MAGTSYGWINPLLPRLLKPDSELPLSPGQGSWVVALIELGDLFSPLPAAKLVDYWGRKPLLLFTAPLYLISWILVLYTRSVPVLYFVRSVSQCELIVVDSPNTHSIYFVERLLHFTMVTRGQCKFKFRLIEIRIKIVPIIT